MLLQRGRQSVPLACMEPPRGENFKCTNAMVDKHCLTHCVQMLLSTNNPQMDLKQQSLSRLHTAISLLSTATVFHTVISYTKSLLSVCVCSDTVSRSGMFCAIATTIERCKTEGVVDVFQVVKALRVQKPGAVRSVVC